MELSGHAKACAVRKDFYLEVTVTMLDAQCLVEAINVEVRELVFFSLFCTCLWTSASMAGTGEHLGETSRASLLLVKR